MEQNQQECLHLCCGECELDLTWLCIVFECMYRRAEFVPRRMGIVLYTDVVGNAWKDLGPKGSEL